MRTFHDYEFEALIGEGAMGRVWRARQLAFDGRLVALKRVPYGDPQLAERLRREGRILAQLDHPHIIRVYELIPDGQGIAIAMQYAPGGSLADLLTREGRLAPPATVTVLAPIAQALGSAHRRGIVHRDVKPSNILFTSDGEPLLSDFGIARLAGDTPLTVPGIAALGTAEYLDPEVVNGEEANARSDVYALGAVCYETLSGRRPFEAPTPMAVLRLADRGRAASLSSLAPDVGRPLAQVVAQAMARRPERRFADAGDLAVALRDSLRPTRRSGPRPPPPARAVPPPSAVAGASAVPSVPEVSPAPAVQLAPAVPPAPAVPGASAVPPLPAGSPAPTGSPVPGARPAPADPAAPPVPPVPAVPTAPVGPREGVHPAAVGQRVAPVGPQTRAFGPRPSAPAPAARSRRRWSTTRWVSAALVVLLLLDAALGTLLVLEREDRLRLSAQVERLQDERERVGEQLRDASPP